MAGCDHDTTIDHSVDLSYLSASPTDVSQVMLVIICYIYVSCIILHLNVFAVVPYLQDIIYIIIMYVALVCIYISLLLFLTCKILVQFLYNSNRNWIRN